jgi:hypothetical protein
MVGTEDLGGCIEVQYYAEADHTFFRASDRERVVAQVVEWATRSFGHLRNFDVPSVVRERI